MTRKALLLSAFFCAFIAAARAQQAAAPKDDVPGQVSQAFLVNLSPDQRGAAGQDATFGRMAAFMSSDQRYATRGGLIELEGGAKPAGLAEIARGYLALDFPEDAARIARLMEDGSKNKAGLLSRAAGAFHRAGKYKEAAETAAEAFRLDPSDKAAEAVAKLSERRFTKKDVPLLHAKPETPPVAALAAPRAAADPMAPGPKPSSVASRLLPRMETYHLPETKPPSFWSQLRMGLGSIWDVMNYKPTPEQTAGIKKLRDMLGSTQTGAGIVKELGGWEQIDKNVLFMYEKMPEDGTAAYVRPMTPWEQKKTGKQLVLAVNSEFLRTNPEIVLPVMGHELWHVADKVNGFGDAELSVASEHGAHLRQVYLFQEMENKLTPAQRKEYEKDHMWMYQKWVASLWEDHLTTRYATKQDYEDQYKGSKNLQYLAGLAYEDVYKRAVKDGTPQVLYHVSDLYANATAEPEVSEEGLLKEIKAEQDPAKRQSLQKLLDEVRQMRRRLFDADDAYRTRTGQTVS